MTRILGFVAAAAITLGLTAPVFNPTPAEARTADEIKILSPGDEVVLPAGSTDFKVLFPAMYGDWTVTLECEKGNSTPGTQEELSGQLFGESYTSVFAFRTTSTDRRCSFYAEASGDWYSYDVHYHDVTPKKLSFTQFTGPDEFFPLVKDRWKDDATFTWRTGAYLPRVAIAVRNKSGRTVRSEPAEYRTGKYSSGPSKWTWDGRNNAGKQLPKGRYVVQLTATDSLGQRATAKVPVRVATRMFNEKKTLRRWGDDGAPSTGGNCYISRSDYDGTASLDCWGGAHATMTYNFKVPANAKVTGWSMQTATSGADQCCHGSIKKSASRVKPTMFQVRLRVTSWRAVEATRATVTYSTKVRR